MEDVTREQFLSTVYPMRLPVILRGADLGDCRHKWTPDRGKRVTVHRGKCKRMNFIEKNFQYSEMDFEEFVSKASLGRDENGDIDSKNCEQNESHASSSSSAPCEWFYLRSLGTDPRKDVSDIAVGFPELAPDFVAPPFVPDGAFFSSVFRIASPGMQLWTHYDVMDNILVQIQGRKRVVLFPPSDALKLYLKGDKSLVIDIDDPDLTQFPRFSNATRHECFMEPGDVLFIPALWFHNVISLDFGVAINIFWRHLPNDAYDPKDVYGNRDPVPAARVMQSLDKNLQTLDKLPEEYRDFYARRMIARIKEKFQLQDD